MLSGMADLSTIARRVAFAKELRGLSLRKLSADAGVSHATVHAMITRDADDAAVETMRALARVLEVSPAWLAFGLGPTPT